MKVNFEDLKLMMDWLEVNTDGLPVDIYIDVDKRSNLQALEIHAYGKRREPFIMKSFDSSEMVEYNPVLIKVDVLGVESDRGKDD